MSFGRFGVLAAGMLAGVAMAGSAGAVPVAGVFDLVSGSPFGGNDCPGDLGEFGDRADPLCSYDGSDFIIKVNFDDEGNKTIDQLNSAFSTIDGSEFSFFFFDEEETGNGTWTYTPGAGDPIITAFTAKGGNIGYNLYSRVEGQDGNSAIPYVTPTNPSGKPAGLSHMIFFDSDGVQPIPLPAAAWLLLGGLGAIGAVARKRRAA